MNNEADVHYQWLDPRLGLGRLSALRRFLRQRGARRLSMYIVTHPGKAKDQSSAF